VNTKNFIFRLRVVALLAILVAAALVAIGPSVTAHADAKSNPGVLPPNSRPFGHTYGEWSNMFWQWAFSIPVHGSGGSILNPLADLTGDQTGTRCAVGQSGHVWFLAGLYNNSASVTRNCTVPTGKGIFFPVFSVENENITWPPHDPPYTLLELRQQLEEVMQSLNGCPDCSVEVDGRPIQGIFSDHDRIGYGNRAFGITIPQDNLFAHTGYPASAGTVYPVVNDGWYVMLAPLRPGQHTIHFVSGATDITYNLVVRH
jgi:hypothetical protein